MRQTNRSILLEVAVYTLAVGIMLVTLRAFVGSMSPDNDPFKFALLGAAWFFASQMVAEIAMGAVGVVVNWRMNK